MELLVLKFDAMVVFFLVWVVVTIVLFLWIYTDKLHPEAPLFDEQQLNKEGENIELLPAEQSKWIRASSINAINFYRGELDCSSIRRRMWKIMVANPWLSGRLFTTSGYFFGKYILRFSRFITIDQSNLRHYVEITINNNKFPKELEFHEASPVSTWLHHLQEHLVPVGTRLVNQTKITEPLFPYNRAVLFRVIVIKIIERGQTKVTKTAFLPSLSHSIADGHTYYQIFQMFHHEQRIRTLNPYRVQDYQKALIPKIGKDVDAFFRSTKLLLAFLWTSLISPRPTLHNFLINTDQIKQLKQEFAEKEKSEEIPFISSNDLLTSWFFRQLDVDYGLVAINYRQRLPQVLPNLAGNYEGGLLFRREGYQRPAFIRSAVQQFRSLYLTLPSWKELIFCNFALVSNWSSFYTEDVLLEEDIPLLRHSPVMIPSNMAMSAVLILYVPKKGQLGAYIMSQDPVTENDWLAAGGNLLKKITGTKKSNNTSSSSNRNNNPGNTTTS